MIVPAIRIGFALIAALLLSLSATASAEETVEARLVVGLYDGKEDGPAVDTRIHDVATMPLNHLGLVVRLYDVRKGLPPDDVMAKARGVLSWFVGDAIDTPGPYLEWVTKQVEAGKKFVIFGNPGIEPADLVSAEQRGQFDRWMRYVGINWENAWVGITHDTEITANDSRVYGFERKPPPILPGYPVVTPADAGVRTYFAVKDKQTGRVSHLALTSPNGGFAASGYIIFASEVDGQKRRAWYLDPFAYFRRAFDTLALPKPDTTTLSGRRMYYSHIDGDAFHNVTRVEEYRDRPTVSAGVAYDKVFKAFPDLPVTVGAVTGDLAAGWYGGPKAIALAKRIYALPNIEAGTHTHSHPFAWGFFKKNDPTKEIPYLPYYPPRPGKTLPQSVWDPAAVEPNALKNPKRPKGGDLSEHYQRPRAYAVKPYDLKMEIEGSIRFLEEKVLPPGKKVEIVQWSGNTLPYYAALAMSRKMGVRNINGGDPRMDGNCRTYACVSGLGREVGGLWQVYSSGANENIYTDGWQRHFAGFQQIVDTFKNTETPVRIKPINVYYHFYTLERSDSMNALLMAIRFARTQAIAPVTASRFAAIVDGFFKARIVRLGPRRWRIEDRDGLATLRFDHATTEAVDFARSTGVVGQTHHQGSLYVALDAGVAAPVVALKTYRATDMPPEADRPYLVGSRWEVRDLATGDGTMRFSAQGFGPGEFRWKMPGTGAYRIVVTGPDGTNETLRATADDDGILSFKVETNDARPRRFVVFRTGDAG